LLTEIWLTPGGIGRHPVLNIPVKRTHR